MAVTKISWMEQDYCERAYVIVRPIQVPGIFFIRFDLCCRFLMNNTNSILDFFLDTNT